MTMGFMAGILKWAGKYSDQIGVCWIRAGGKPGYSCTGYGWGISLCLLVPARGYGVTEYWLRKCKSGYSFLK